MAKGKDVPKSRSGVEKASPPQSSARWKVQSTMGQMALLFEK